MFKHEHQRGQGLTVTFCPHPLLVSSEPSVHCTRVIAMRSGQSPVGSCVQQTHNCAEQHPRYEVSPRVCRPAGRQSSRWQCGDPSTVTCGSNHNRPFKQPPSLTADVNKVLDGIARGRSRNHGRRPSFLLPSRKAGATSDLPVRNSQFMKSRHDWMQCDDKCFVSKSEGFSLPLIGLSRNAPWAIFS